MYLKSIEVQGFKSFANKILFEFQDGITGIVGPNGSGKSNVADAVRWVLGEQSAKQLRGARMEDVIFSGTETRKPLGFAFVAITFDNSDHKLPVEYKEVTVSRRVYRSGESEYRINGGNCRLRDVQEIFLDTGIGKEGYSIIGQGQIDKILSGKPEERRELFDEAAGITKFKKRKSVAEKNLEAERLNLSRITDILSELEKQIGPLERQSKVAREYLSLKEELKAHEIASFLKEYEDAQTSRRELEEKLSVATAQMEEASRQKEEMKAEYDRLEAELEEKGREMDSCNTLIADTRIKKEKLEGSRKVLQEQILAARQNASHYQERIQAAQAKLSEHQKEYESFCSQKDGMSEALSVIQDHQAGAEEQIRNIEAEMSELSRQTEATRQQVLAYENQNTEYRTNIENQENTLEQMGIRRTYLNQRILKNKSEEAGWKESKRSHQEEDYKLTKEANRLQNSLKEAEDAFGLLSTQERSVQKELDEVRQEQVRKQSKLDSLQNMAERYEGYGNSIRRVMEQKEKNSGIIGVVADIIQVKKDYEIAIETALGGSIQNIVTDTEETAKDMIEYLKQNKFGRATFLPLTAMNAGRENRRDSSLVLLEQGVLGMASSLVEAQERFSGLVEHLLGRIVVVDYIDHAVALARKYHYSLRIVTIEGEQFTPGGALSGGAYKNSSNLLGRRRELDELTKETKRLASRCKKLSQELEEKSEKKKKHSSLVETYQKSLQELFLKQNTVHMELKQEEQHLETIQNSYAEISLEEANLDRQIKETKEGIKKFHKKIEENTDIQNKNRLEIEAYVERSTYLEGQSQEWKEKLAAWKLEFVSQEQSSQYLLENMKRVHREMETLKEELAQLRHNSSGLLTTAREKEKQMEDEKHQIEQAEQMIQEAKKRRDELRNIREQMNESYKGFFAKREEVSGVVSGLDKEIFRLSSQKEKLSEQLNTQVHYMWEEYEITYSMARDLQRQSDAISGSLLLSPIARKKLEGELHSKIRKLGDVNVNAIEDFRNMKERYTLLSTQREDVIKAEEVLIGVIADLDTEMRHQFKEKFQEIKVQFHQVFQELFGGGRGTLELMEDEDVLEAGIRITAQPPGKKLQNMMQLSGGEKALTAISLLFAIQNLKPSPFCLLDEIEAALDDSNVVRFAQYLHKLTPNTQFIVITHRRGTMNAAHILYGITMQEKGISTLVSVNLVEDSVN